MKTELILLVGGACVLGASLLGACGEQPKYVPPSVEETRRNEGIERAAAAAATDTAEMSAIRGVVTDTPGGSVRTGALVWRALAVEDVTRGVARSWSSVDARWIGIRLALAYDRPDSTAPFETQTVILREQLVLLDDEGGRHAPLAVHDRITPRIDLPWRIPREGDSATILFPIPRELSPAALEINAPLGAGRIEWSWPESPSNWITLDGKAIIEDRSQRTLWDVTLRRVRFVPGADAARGDSSRGEFQADLTLRNVTPSPALSPDPADARLYTGGGTTLRSVALPAQRMVEPGKIVSFTVRFLDVPAREGLEVVLPYRDVFTRINAMPGLLPENPVPMSDPTLSSGLRIAVYGASSRSGFAVRVGLLNNGSRPIAIARTRIAGMTDLASSAAEGVMENAPDTLYPGFEERRWVMFPRRVGALRFEIPGRAPIGVKL